MKRRIVFALISVLICVGAAVWLVPYTPVPDMDGFWNVRIWARQWRGHDRTDRAGRSDRSARGADAGQSQPCAAPEAQLLDG